ncbi:hypothetical protein ACEE86_21895, partial [Proteus mirabilis]
FASRRRNTSFMSVSWARRGVEETDITLGVQAGYAHSVSGSSAEGYNGQATLNVTF